MLGETVFMLCMFGYFLCVTAAYQVDMEGPEEEAKPEEPPVEEPPKEEGDDEKPKSQKSGEEAPKEEGDAPPEGDPPAE